MHALIFSIETGRFGPARMPEALNSAGIATSVLCPAGDLLAESSFALNRFVLPSGRSARRLGKALVRAVEMSRARIVIPGDEQAIMIMRATLDRRGGRDLRDGVRRALSLSLGPADRFDATIFKSHTLALARSLGIRTPDGDTARNVDHAIAIASRLGFPVYLKESFSWAGLGVHRCDNAQDVRRAFRVPDRWEIVRRSLRRAMARDWFPRHTPCDVQRAVSGQSAMFCGFAWQGKLLGGYAGQRIEQLYANGPSRSVRLSHDPRMAQAAQAMIEALGFSGFFSFDFMLPDDGTMPVLLECNPRVVPITQAGAQLGVDMIAMLARCLRGRRLPGTPAFADRTVDLLLFPYSLAARSDEHRLAIDCPKADTGLVAAAVARGLVHGDRAAPVAVPAAAARSNITPTLGQPALACA